MSDSGTYQRRRYPTLSLYEGLFDPNRQCMNGYGRYMYADGSEYRGYFQNGKFHGYGRLRLAPPYKFTFKGTFQEGKLVSIEEMGFADGLSVIADIKNGRLDTSNWVYCVPQDRRFSNEMNEGLQPAGPNFQITRQRPTRQLSPGTFDAEEGIYKPHSGFLIHCPPPFSPSRFIACEEEAKWIIENCRYQPPDTEDESKRSGAHSFIDQALMRKEPNEYFSRLIMRANIEGSLSLDERKAERSMVTTIGGDASKYLKNLCLRKKSNEASDEKNCPQGPPSTPTSGECSTDSHELTPFDASSNASCDSFIDRSLADDVSRKVCAKPSFDTSGSSISLRNSVMKDARSYNIHFGFH